MWVGGEEGGASSVEGESDISTVCMCLSISIGTFGSPVTRPPHETISNSILFILLPPMRNLKHSAYLQLTKALNTVVLVG